VETNLVNRTDMKSYHLTLASISNETHFLQARCTSEVLQ